LGNLWVGHLGLKSVVHLVHWKVELKVAWKENMMVVRKVSSSVVLMVKQTGMNKVAMMEQWSVLNLVEWEQWKVVKMAH
jgi:hypothetical protein